MTTSAATSAFAVTPTMTPPFTSLAVLHANCLEHHVCVFHGVLTPKRALMDARHMSHIAACDCAQLGKLMDLVSTCLPPMPLATTTLGLLKPLGHTARTCPLRHSRSSHVICSARDVTKVQVNGELRDHNLLHDDLPLWAWLVLQWDIRPRGVPSNQCAHAHSRWPTAQATTAWTTWRISPDCHWRSSSPMISSGLITPVPCTSRLVPKKNWGSWIPNSASFLQYATSFHRNTICDWPPILPLATC